MAALAADRRICLLPRGGLPHDRGQLGAGLRRAGTRQAIHLAFTSPDFTSRSGDIWDGMMESIIMTVAASVVGIGISIPIALGAARECRALAGLSDLPWHHRDQPRACRRSSLRSCWWPFSVLARWPGFLTLEFCHHRVSVQAAGRGHRKHGPGTGRGDPGVGGKRWGQWINYGVQPQVMPRLIGLSMYRIDINFPRKCHSGSGRCRRHWRDAQHRL